MSVPFAYHDLARAGKVFTAMSTTPLAIPIYNTTAPKFVFWNKAGSGVNMVPIRYSAGTTTTTEAPGNIQLAYLAAGDALGTAAPMSVFTDTTVTNSLIGRGSANVVRFAVAATLTAAGTPFITLGMSHLTTTTTATFGGFMATYDFWETVVVPPGYAIYSIAQAATAMLYNETMIWYEEPV